MPYSLADHHAQFLRLSVPGLLGFYDYFEVFEILAFVHGVPQNVFTLIVGVEGTADPALQAPTMVTHRLESVRKLDRWSVGIFKWHRSPAEIAAALDRYATSRVWQLYARPIAVGELHAIPKQFVPADAVEHLAWNRVLKNNFWNGSQLLELADEKKTASDPIFETPESLLQISEIIKGHLPMGLAGLSDRIGNIVVQLPVTAVQAKVQRDQSGAFRLEVAWHPRATPRRLSTSCEILFDKGYSSFDVVESPAAASSHTPLTILNPVTHYRAVTWDPGNSAIVAASGVSGFINAVKINGTMIYGQRRFLAPQTDGTLVQETVLLSRRAISQQVGRQESDGNGGWTQTRLFQEGITELTANLQFMQYMGGRTSQADAVRAYDDVRTLINRHGGEGVWLWDPYLTADDIIKTLFYCMHSGSKMRAISDAKKFKAAHEPEHVSIWTPHAKKWHVKRSNKDIPWLATQRLRLESAKGDCNGLNLEFRAAFDDTGFHDRFLIFPRDKAGALAWSLGTSVNSLGGEHHVIQKVADGQLIANAFEDQWNRLYRPTQLVWKAP